MIRSESLDALSAALSAAQGEFEAVSKTAANPFFKSKFAPLPEVVKAATPILSKHGLAVWQGPDVNEHGHDVLWTVVLHSSGQYIGSAGKLYLVKNDPQAHGSAITYGRRYNYMAGTGLVADEDDDGEGGSGRGRSKPPSRGRTSTRGKVPPTPSDGHSGAKGTSGDTQDGAAPVTTEQLENIATLARSVKLTPAQWKALAKEVGAEGKKSNQLTEDQAGWVIVKLAATERAVVATEAEAK